MEKEEEMVVVSKLVENDQVEPRLLDEKLLEAAVEEMAKDVGSEHWLDCGRC